MVKKRRIYATFPKTNVCNFVGFVNTKPGFRQYKSCVNADFVNINRVNANFVNIKNPRLSGFRIGKKPAIKRVSYWQKPG